MSAKRKNESVEGVVDGKKQSDDLEKNQSDGLKKKQAGGDDLKKKHKKSKAYNYTICIPSTIISSGNAKTLGQVTQIAYEVAKAATIYNVAEIVVLDIPDKSAKSDDTQEAVREGNKIKFNFTDTKKDEEANSVEEPVENSENALAFASLLQYFVTPPYLVKSVFKETKYFKYVSKYPTLTTLPFMVTNYLDCNATNTYREGLSIPEKTSKPKHVPGTKVKKGKKADRLALTKYVNVGLEKPLELASERIPVNVRVTVNMAEKTIASPHEAYYSDKIGAKVSVGYLVRIAKLFSSVFTESGFPDGYTSAVYVEGGSYFCNKNADDNTKPITKLVSTNKFAKNSNILVMVGKKSDFYTSFKDDKSLSEVSEINEFFNYQLSIPPLVRIEDAILISLAKLDSI